MNLFDRFQAAVKGWFSDGSQFGSVIWSNGQPRQLPGERQSFDGNTIVQACLGKIAKEFVTARLATATTGADGKAVFDHASEFASRWLRPVPGEKTTAARILKAAVTSYKLDGNAYFEVALDAAGDVAEIDYVPHWAIEPIQNGRGRLSHYEITFADGRKERREPGQIVHVADGVDPGNRLKGRSAMKCLLEQVMTDNEADAYSAEIILNPAIAGWAVLPTGDRDPGPENAALVESKIQAKFGRGGRGGVFVPAFKADVKTLGFSPEQLALDKLRRVPEERISAVCNVPAIVAGLGAGLDRSTYANMEEARRYFVRGEMAGLWQDFADAFTSQLPGSFDERKGERAAFDLRHVPELHEPLQDLWDRVGAAYDRGLLRRGQCLEAMGYEATPADDVYTYDVGPGASARTEQTKAKLADRRRAARALRDADDEEEA